MSLHCRTKWVNFIWFWGWSSLCVLYYMLCDLQMEAELRRSYPSSVSVSAASIWPRRRLRGPASSQTGSSLVRLRPSSCPCVCLSKSTSPATRCVSLWWAKTCSAAMDPIAKFQPRSCLRRWDDDAASYSEGYSGWMYLYQGKDTLKVSGLFQHRRHLNCISAFFNFTSSHFTQNI